MKIKIIEDDIKLTELDKAKALEIMEEELNKISNSLSKIAGLYESSNEMGEFLNSDEILNPFNINIDLPYKRSVDEEAMAYREYADAIEEKKINIVEKLDKKDLKQFEATKKIDVNAVAKKLQEEALQTNVGLLEDWMGELVDVSNDPEDWNHHDIELIDWQIENISRIKDMFEPDEIKQSLKDQISDSVNRARKLSSQYWEYDNKNGREI